MSESSLLRVPQFPDHLSHDRAGLHFRQVTYKSNPLVVGAAAWTRTSKRCQRIVFRAVGNASAFVLAAFTQAASAGDLDSWSQCCAEDAVLITDGGPEGTCAAGFITSRRRSTVPGKLLHGNRSESSPREKNQSGSIHCTRHKAARNPGMKRPARIRRDASRSDAAQAVQTPGAPLSSDASRFFQHLQPPQFRTPDKPPSSPLFGQSTQMLGASLGSGGQNGGLNPLYQIGGPRSAQLALKLLF